ncbi:ribonuclease H-like domain-containing protein [Tanacetum coccineum]|uniref:Ribonuclease H-like domain-containing protein n=1 Tax=Tanacetum coccineum TaxID=301880 RepID=A0ABQ4ZH16_9ASTR
MLGYASSSCHSGFCSAIVILLSSYSGDRQHESASNPGNVLKMAKNFVPMIRRSIGMRDAKDALGLFLDCTLIDFKIKKTVGTSSGGQNLAFMTAPSSSSINDANTAYSQSVTTVISWDTLLENAEHQEVRKISSEIKTTPGSKEATKTTLQDNVCAIDGCKVLIEVNAENKFQSNMLLNGIFRLRAKDAIDFKIEKFDKASKDLDQLLGSQITDKSKKGFGYCAVPLPHPLIYNRPNKRDLSYSGLDEFKEPEFKGYGPENSMKESNIVKESDNSKENSDKSLVKELESRENNDAPIIEDWVSDDEEQDESITRPEKKTVTPTAAKIEKPVRKSVREVVLTIKRNRCGCSRHMTGNIAYLSDFKQFDGGYVAFGGGAYGGKITGKGTLKTANLDFEDLPDENQILLKVPRKDNMYSFDMKNIVPKESLTCLVAKATLDESMLWHRRLGHINFKNINKLVKDNLDETSEILKRFIKEIENLVDKKVKIIRSDNGTEFKNKVMDDFCREKARRRCLNNENAEQERFSIDSSSKDVNVVGQQVNTASLDLNTGSLELNVLVHQLVLLVQMKKTALKKNQKIEPTSIDIKLYCDSSRVEANAGRTLALQTSTSLDFGESPNGRRHWNKKGPSINKKDEREIVRLGIKQC